MYGVIRLVDDDSDTATEGEEEIRARELRKQEVRVEPPVVHTDTGTDTEVKSTSNLLDPKNSELPDILSSHDKLKPHNKSLDNLSGSSPDSADFDSCIGSPDKSDILTSKSLKVNHLTKSATVGALGPAKVKRNFVIPPKEQRKTFGKEFIPTQQLPEPQPLLIIKRTPSKINLPPEVGKPKVALKANINIESKKYFGEASAKTVTKPPPKPILKRAETLKNSANQSKLVKQISLPETDVEKENTKSSQSFNFEPEDSDIRDVDNYIEDLLAKKDELLKPIDPSKYTFTCTNEDEEEKVSSSIEDLLKALEVETKVDPSEIADKPEEKIEDLLNWMDNLDHQTQERKVYRSYSDVKYKNLERILKAPKKADAVISKIPKDNLTYFERHMSGKSIDPEQVDCNFKLTRSKTDVFCNKPRTSVDLDAVTNVDIKKVLMKFEKQNTEDELDSKPPLNLPKRKSFSNFKFAAKHQDNTDSSDGCKKTLLNSKSMVNVSQIRENLLNKARSTSNSRRNSYNENLQNDNSGKVESRNKELENEDQELCNILKDIEDFVDSTINKIGSTNTGEQVDKQKEQILTENKENVGQNKMISNESNQKNNVKTSNGNITEIAKQKESEVKCSEQDEIENKSEVLQEKNKSNCSSKKRQDKMPQHLNKPKNQCKEVEQTTEVNETNNNLPKTASNVSLCAEINNVNGSTESVHSFRSAVDNPNLLEEKDTPTQYSVTVNVTESRVYPQFQQNNTTPTINIDDLYAKVNKENKNTAPPSPTPRRNKTEIETPQRPKRQKSFEGKKNPATAFKSQIPVPVNSAVQTPVVPHRKRSTNSLPQCPESGPKKETVKSFNAPKPQKVEVRNRDSKSKEKDCCLQ